MKLKLMLGFLVVAALALLAIREGGVPAAAQERSGPLNRASKAQLDRWMKEYSNWGRWGQDDQLGTMNLITPAKRQAAAKLVTSGITVSMAHDILTIPSGYQGFVLKPAIAAIRGVATDKLELEAHNGTHLDALCHVAWDGMLYNGIAFKDIVKIPDGCAKLDIARLKNGIVTRGILIDIPRLKGVPYLEAGTPVYKEDLEAWEKYANVKIGSGDAIFLRTGRWAERPTPGQSGFDSSAMPFIRERDVALLSSDGVHEVGTLPGCPDKQPPDNDPLSASVCRIPVHHFTIIALGMNLIDNMDLEAVAETAAKLKRWEFLFTVAPLRVPNGTGSPVNPLATF